MPTLTIYEFLDWPEPCTLQALGEVKVVSEGSDVVLRGSKVLTVSLDFHLTTLSVSLSISVAQFLVNYHGCEWFLEWAKDRIYEDLLQRVSKVLDCDEEEAPTVEFQVLWNTTVDQVLDDDDPDWHKVLERAHAAESEHHETVISESLLASLESLAFDDEDH